MRRIHVLNYTLKCVVESIIITTPFRVWTKILEKIFVSTPFRVWTIALFVIFFNTSFVIVEAQLQGQALIDSLLNELPKMKEDTNAVKLLAVLSYEFYLNNPDEGIKYGEKGLKLSEKIDWEEGKARCYNSLGVVYSFGKSNYTKSLEYYSKALKIYEDLGNKFGLASIINNIGIIYQYQSKYSKALEYYHKALKIYEKLDYKYGIASNLNNIGIIYQYQSNPIKALEYYHKALKINEEIKNTNWIANNLVGIGSIYKNQSNYPIALEYYFKALKIYEELGNNNGKAINLGNIGSIYMKQSDYSKALDYFLKALKIDEELGTKSGVARQLGNIGELYLTQAKDSIIENSPNKMNLLLNKKINLNQSIEYTKKTIILFKEFGAIHQQSYFLNNLSQAYELKGEYKNAFAAYREYKTLQDSVFSMDKVKDIANLETKRDNELKDREIVILQTQKKAQQFQSYLLSGGVIILFGAFGVAFLRFREKKKLSEALEIQKNIVEEKNEEIHASMTYASTIQNAILPWESTLKNAFNDIFVLYKPKDIVSGDSYWFQEIDGIKYLAVIDCTGHGIPGAMLTVIASTALDDAVLSKKLTVTGDILTYMNEKVTEVLNQKLAENKIRDGMEVALIAIHNNKIQFSGAGRPLYCKNGTMEVIKTDKRGIAGQTENDDYQFSSTDITKSQNLTLYLTSDGFADQMNEQSKKYSTKRFTNLLESISEKPISEQYETLENEFNSHKGERNQIDDITVLGVRV